MNVRWGFTMNGWVDGSVVECVWEIVARAAHETPWHVAPQNEITPYDDSYAICSMLYGVHSTQATEKKEKNLEFQRPPHLSWNKQQNRKQKHTHSSHKVDYSTDSNQIGILITIIHHGSYQANRT